MKKSLLAVAVLGAFAGAASAQSSVTLSGTVDVNLRYVKNDDTKFKQLGTDGINSSQLVFSGREDLGSGTWAGFTLNSGINPDTGTSNSKFWNRRSTVSLGGNFGEIRLGRDYNPTFWNMTVFDPFGTNGVGDMTHAFTNPSVGGLTAAQSALLPAGGEAGTANTTTVRSDNAVQYYLPSNLGGVYGNVMIAAGEGNPNSRYEGGRIGYAAGPINVGFAYGQTHLLVKDNKLKHFDFGASYDFGFAKLVGQYIRLKTNEIGGVSGVDGTQDIWQIGTVIPLGQGEIHASYNRNKGKDDLEDVGSKMAAIGYVYNLSKRTALYGTYSYLKNDTNGFYAVGGSVPAGQTLGFKSQGAEFGLRHFF